jgi:hypothetical protein
MLDALYLLMELYTPKTFTDGLAVTFVLLCSIGWLYIFASFVSFS